MRHVCLLGATGSIGTQTLDVIISNPDSFILDAISIGHQVDKLDDIFSKFPSVHYCCIQEEKDMLIYQNKYPNIKFFHGNSGLISLILESKSEMVVNALVGFVGLVPTIRALEDNRIVCLANKEALVVGGELVNDLLNRGYGKLYPIDSEHVAIHKCLKVDNKNVKKLIITASGGAFRKLSRKQLKNVTKEDALNHPTWSMGQKITIDSASMANKCFEVIEAHYLFNYPFSKIDTILHYESYVHSLVEYKDNTFRMQVGKPDMREPIKYALFETNITFETLTMDDYHNYKDLTFLPFDKKRYPIIKHAKTVIKNKGTYGAVLNSANEEAVYAFLKGEINFLDIEKIIDFFMKKHENNLHPSLEDLVEIDRITRDEVKRYIKGDY